MEHIKVESSNIESIGHEGETMHVTFKHGGTYVYQGVDKDVFNDILSAPSVGKYLRSLGIQGEKLSDDEQGK